MEKPSDRLVKHPPRRQIFRGCFRVNRSTYHHVPFLSEWFEFAWCRWHALSAVCSPRADSSSRVRVSFWPAPRTIRSRSPRSCAVCSNPHFWWAPNLARERGREKNWIRWEYEAFGYQWQFHSIRMKKMDNKIKGEKNYLMRNLNELATLRFLILSC